MKKIYTKPDIAFESFSLCTSIAGPCAIKTWTPFQWTCGFMFDGVMVFNSSISGCVEYVQGEMIGICYDVPSASNALFNS